MNTRGGSRRHGRSLKIFIDFHLMFTFPVMKYVEPAADAVELRGLVASLGELRVWNQELQELLGALLAVLLHVILQAVVIPDLIDLS